MAVSIDTVYQRVLALANKEQRGYVTPLEFNLFANQAQMNIFEQYFYDLNQFEKMPGGKSNTEYSNMVSLLNEKITIFEQETTSNLTSPSTGVFTLPTNIYRLGTVIVQHSPGYQSTVQAPSGYVDPTWVPADEVTEQEYRNYNLSSLGLVSVYSPIYIRRGLNISVPNASSVRCTYVRKPYKVEWGYDVVGTFKKALYNATKSIDFELHDSEETNLVNNILELAGITIQDMGLIQIADKEDLSKKQQQKL